MPGRFPQFLRRPWVRRTLIALLVLIAAELLLSWHISTKLRRALALRTNAQPKLGQCWYIPPFGLHPADAAIVRDHWELVRIGSIPLRLARLPFSEPLVIESISIDDLTVRLNAPLLAGSLSMASSNPPAKLSDMLRLKRLRVDGGRIVYVNDQAAFDPPTVLKN